MFSLKNILLKFIFRFSFQSIAFHEGGKRHKANVAKRITELSKQSIKDEKAKQKVDQQIRQMEDAAMRAYSADISRGADMTSKAINAFQALQESSEEASVKTTGHTPGPSALPARAIDPLMPPIDVLEDEEREKRERMKRKGEIKSWTNETESTESMWCEAKSDDGHTYYWNVKTGGSALLFYSLQPLVIVFFLFRYQVGSAQRRLHDIGGIQSNQ